MAPPASDLFFVALLALGFLAAEFHPPTPRAFSPTDPSISNPFTVHERVPGLVCLAIAAFTPAAAVAGTLFVPFKPSSWHSPQRWAALQRGLLALAFVLALNGLSTDLLKNWIGRPRPDLLARCGASTAATGPLITIAECTAPLGAAVLQDGFRSCPSGHTSFAFAGLGFTAWWIGTHLRVFDRGVSVGWLLLGCVAPVLGAAYIGASRLVDYRHHFEDVFFGFAVGLGCLGLGVLKYGKGDEVLDASLPPSSLV